MITERPLKDREYKWIDVQEPEIADFDRLNKEFALPYLLVQDCLRPEHLPKYEETEAGHFLMMRVFDEESDETDTTVQDLTRKIALFIKDNQLISIHRVKLKSVEKVSEKVLSSEAPKELHGLIHLFVLSVIRSYEPPIERLLDVYEDLEKEMLAQRAENVSTKRIYHFRKQLFTLKRILKLTNDSLYRFRDFWADEPSMLQDLRENIDQLYFQLEEISHNFDNLFELHIALNDKRANEVMKILTVFSSVLLPLNFIASFYGMNFTHIPGLNSINALHEVVFIMVLMTLLIVWYFRRKGWFKTSRD